MSSYLEHMPVDKAANFIPETNLKKILTFYSSLSKLIDSYISLVFRRRHVALQARPTEVWGQQSLLYSSWERSCHRWLCKVSNHKKNATQSLECACSGPPWVVSEAHWLLFLLPRYRKHLRKKNLLILLAAWSFGNICSPWAGWLPERSCGWGLHGGCATGSLNISLNISCLGSLHFIPCYNKAFTLDVVGRDGSGTR